MFAVLYCIIIVYGCLKKRKKHNSKYWKYIVIVFLVIVLYSSVDPPDYLNYKIAYDYIGTGAKYSDLGLGWYYLNKIGNDIGLNYKQFQTIILFIGLYLVNGFYQQVLLEDNKQIWSLYLLYPALLDCVQIRFFFASAIVLTGFRFYDCTSIKKSLLFVLSLLISYSIHSSTAVYFVLIIIPVCKTINLKKAFKWLIIISSALIIFAKPLMIKIFGFFINSGRIERYFNSDDGAGFLGIVAYIGTLILFLYLSNKNMKIIKKDMNNIILNMLGKSKISIFFENVFYTNIALCILLPLSFFDTNLFRLHRIAWHLIYAEFVFLGKNLSIYEISICNRTIRVPIAFVSNGIALLGLIFYIMFFNFNVIESFLLGGTR